MATPTLEQRVGALEEAALSAKVIDLSAARREGAALALEQLANEMDESFSMFDDLCPRKLARGLRERAERYRSGKRTL